MNPITKEDVARSMSLRLPPGKAIRRGLGSMFRKLFLGLGVEIAFVYNRAAALVDEMHPLTCSELLPEWEADYGLPDDCAPDSQTVAQRRTSLVAKFHGKRSFTTANVIALAASVGFDITIVEPTPMMFGDPFGELFYGDSRWNYVWIVEAPEQTLELMEFGDPYSESFGTFGNELLECTLRGINQAHKKLFFSYS